MGNGMNKVLPGLYVGNYRDSKDATQLERFGITHILAIHDAARQLHPDKHYLCILAADTPDQNLSQYFSLCNDFIHAARLRGGNVLIHCLAGMSRSVTVAVAYIMSITNLSWKEALKVVRVGRAVANPNVGFQRQLEDFESSRLQEERRRLKERFPSLALTVTDAEACRANLSNYETLALAREVCEGKCAMGRPCPTGLCRQRSKRTLRRKSSTSSTGSLSSSGRTPPQTPRFLPSAPPSPAMPRSASVVSATARPRSGPAGLLSYTGSAPPSRAVSRVDLSAAVACSSSSISSSTTNLLTAGRASLTAAGNNDRRVTGSAPETPNKTPPASPMHTARRTSGRRVVESPAVAPIDAPPDSPKYLAQRGIAESVNRRTTRSPTAAASLESPSNSTPPAAGPSPARQPRSSAPPGRSSIGFPSSVGLLESSSSMGPSNDRQQDPAFAATIIGNKRLLPPVELATPSRRSSSSVQNQSRRCFLSEKTNLASTSSTPNLNRR